MKKIITESEKEAHEAQKIYNRKYSGYKRTLKTFIEENGLKNMELRLEFLLQHPHTKLPRPEFDYQQTVSCFRDAIDEYKESLRINSAA